VEVILDIAGDQIPGARDYQEDAFLTTYLGDEGSEYKSSALVVVADGMGGHAAGNIASNLVVSTFNKTFTGKFGKEDPPAVLREALKYANDGLRESIKETPALDGMGCTMVTAAFNKGKVFWISVGDSHLYLIRDRELVKKNEDHSYGGYLDRMRAQGIDVEAEAGLSRNMLMSAMTGDEIAEVDCPKQGFQLLPGDRVIIASDGLDTLTEDQILKTSAWSHTPKECVSALLGAVDEAKKPRQDNTTIVVVDVLERPKTDAGVPRPDVQTRAEPQPVREELARERDFQPEREGGRRGLVVGLIVFLSLAAGGGYFYSTGMWKQWLPADEAPPAPQATSPEPPEPATTPPAVDVTKRGPPREFRDTLRSGGKGPVMVVIPAGIFRMGSGRHSVRVDERPRHEVDLESFAISKYEVTLAEYERFARATGRRVPSATGLDKKTRPVTNVSWDEAVAYTRWLSKQTGKRYRLPSEAEWEYAASAGADTPFWWGFDVGSDKAHCFDCNTGLNPRLPTAVGRFDANPFGLHDTAGNVAEWVHDCYHPDYKGAPGDGSVWEGGDCSHRMARGGSFSSPSTSIRSKKRSKRKAQLGYDSVGFRVVREL